MAGRKDRKAELVTQLARARASLDRSAAQVRDAVDIPRRIRRSVGQNLFVWLGGAALIGVVISKLPRRTKKVYVDADGKRIASSGVAKTGMLLAAAKVAFDFARPTLMKMAAERLEPLIHDFIQRRHNRE